MSLSHVPENIKNIHKMKKTSHITAYIRTLKDFGKTVLKISTSSPNTINTVTTHFGSIFTYKHKKYSFFLNIHTAIVCNNSEQCLVSSVEMHLTEKFQLELSTSSFIHCNRVLLVLSPQAGERLLLNALRASTGGRRSTRAWCFEGPGFSSRPPGRSPPCARRPIAPSGGQAVTLHTI